MSFSGRAPIFSERAYLRSGVGAWPLEDQRRALPPTDRKRIQYVDDLPPSSLRARRPEALAQRAAMLDACREGETIIVASLTCLALDTHDLTHVLHATGRQRVFVRVLDIEHEIPPGVVEPELIDVIALWTETRRRQQTQAARARGTTAAAREARARLNKALAIARPLWADTTIPARDVADRAGVSVATLYNHLNARNAHKEGS